MFNINDDKNDSNMYDTDLDQDDNFNQILFLLC